MFVYMPQSSPETLDVAATSSIDWKFEGAVFEGRV
jgi:hypothetical protein